MIGDYFSRRQVLKAGVLSALGITLADVLRLRAHHDDKPKSCILIWLDGGPSHLETFDPKPELQRLHGQPLPASFGMVKTRRNVEIANAKLRGDAFEFALDTLGNPGGERHGYRGKVSGDTIEGEVAWGYGAFAKRYPWKASRVERAAEPFAH